MQLTRAENKPLVTLYLHTLRSYVTSSLSQRTADAFSIKTRKKSAILNDIHRNRKQSVIEILTQLFNYELLLFSSHKLVKILMNEYIIGK